MAEASVESKRFYCHACSLYVTDLPTNQFFCPRCESGFVEEVGNDFEDENFRNQTMSDLQGVQGGLDTSLRNFRSFTSDGEMDLFPFSFSALQNHSTTRAGPETSRNGQQSSRNNNNEPSSNNNTNRRYNLRVRTSRPNAQTQTRRSQPSTTSTNVPRPLAIRDILGDDLMFDLDDILPHPLHLLQHLGNRFRFPGDPGFANEIEDARVQINMLLGALEQANSGAPPAQKSTIEGIPEIKITEKETKSGKDCPVCMERFKIDDTAKELACKHIFHIYCIDQWLKLHNTCPLCRKGVDGPTPNNNNNGETPSTSFIQFNTSNEDVPIDILTHFSP